MTKEFRKEMEHLPTRDYFEWLCQIIKGYGGKNKKVVEVGAAWGISTRAILLQKNVGFLTTIDVDFSHRAYAEVADLKAIERWKFINDDSTMALKRLAANSVNIVYLDGDHSKDKTLDDCFAGWRLLRNGGWLILDDVYHYKNFDGQYGRGGHYGVTLAMVDFIKRQKAAAVVYPSHNGFAVVEKA
jgi:predicted O-methyltransferase YrrM